MILGADQFDRVGATLGGLWTERVGAPFSTNMSTEGSYAVFDATGWHVATLAGTLGTNHYLQCWFKAINSSNNAGLVWKFQDNDNFYFMIMQPTVGVRLFRRSGGVTSGILATFATPDSVGFNRFAVNHVGNRITIYANQSYDTTAGREAPIIDFTDGAPVVGAGLCGITSSGNAVSGIGTVAWNDFCCRDGDGDTIYVDLDFNGGVPGEGWGSADRPDLNIDWALNNCGCQNGSVVKMTDPGPIGDAATPIAFSIGHAGKFGAAGYSFPTYDPDNGRVIAAGAPNLTIEGRDGGRTIFQESDGFKPFFKLRSDAKGVLIRGIDFLLSGTTGAAISLGSATTTDHSMQYAKCTFYSSAVGGSNQANTYDALSTLDVQVVYCYFKVNQGLNNYFDNIVSRVRRYVADYCIFQGKGATAPMRAAINADSGSDPQAGDAWRISHCDFIDLYRDLFDDAAFAIQDRVGFLGAVEFRDNIIRGKDTLATSFGVYTSGGAVGGLVSCHHNGYHNVTTPRDVGATNTGNEITGDPIFNAPATAFLWPHTAGKGMNGEGTFAGITLDGDYRPTNPAYIDSASDSSTLQGVLDRGALQSYVEPAEPVFTPDGGIEPETFCTEVIYDPGGPNEMDLSGRLITMRAIRMEKDILLRQYRGNDIDLDFLDPDSFFSPTNAMAFLRDANGVPNWFGKEVIIRGRLGNAILHEYVGFVLGVSTSRGIGTIRLGNRFQYLFQKPVLANDVGRVVSTTNAVGSPAIGPPATGSYLAQTGLGVNTVNGCKVEEWTFTFTTVQDYYITGSVTGFDGYGNINNFTTSISGAITVGIVGAGGWNGAFAAGNKVKVLTVFRSFPWAAGLGRFVEQVYKHFLLSPQGAALTANDLDLVGIDAMKGTIADQLCRPFLVDRPATVIDGVDQISRHMGGVTIEKANRRIGFSTYLPRTVLLQDDILCKSDDLMNASFDHAPVYNEFEIAHTYDEATQEYAGGFRFPRLDIDNASLLKYGRRLPAPTALDLRCYTTANNSELVDLIAALNYLRFSDPRIIGSIRTKLSRLGAELDDLYRLESAEPNVSLDFVEPYSIEKKLTDDLTIQMDIIDVSDLVTLGTTGCGFMVYDGPHTYDDCWFYL